MVLDSLTKEEKKNGAEVHHYDFSHLGGETTKSAHHEGDTNILVLNPWVMSSTSQSSPHTTTSLLLQNTMDYLRVRSRWLRATSSITMSMRCQSHTAEKTVVFDGGIIGYTVWRLS